ncbi:MAG: SCO family protein [Pseudomonadota bacterium]|nr:SCO family protein [Pseudomonadota bacterium]
MPTRSVYLYFGVALLVLVLGFGLRIFVFDDQSIARAGKQLDIGLSGASAIGGTFTLVDHNGKTVTEKDFFGRYMLVFFGYTNCPDFCPLTLNTLTEVLDKMGKEAEKIRPVFVSMDPRRDTPAVVREYLKGFHQSFIGLTGTTGQVNAVKRIFRIYSQVRLNPDQGANSTYRDPNEEILEEDYLLDHSSITYLMGPDGSFRTFIRYNTNAEAMLAKLRKHL